MMGDKKNKRYLWLWECKFKLQIQECAIDYNLLSSFPLFVIQQASKSLEWTPGLFLLSYVPFFDYQFDHNWGHSASLHTKYRKIYDDVCGILGSYLMTFQEN